MGILQFFRDRSKRKHQEHILGSFKPEERPVVRALAFDHICPDCGGDSFTMGPQCGMSQNIKCSNLECGSEFTVAPFEDGHWLGVPMMAERTDRSEQDAVSIYGRGYGAKHATA